MHLNTLDELFAYRLGSALTMEHDSLSMLGELERAAVSNEVTKMLRHHADETREQINNLTAAFAAAGFELKEKPSPTTKGLAQEGQALIGKVDDDLRDATALSAACGTEHFEIASYRSLITVGNALGMDDVCELLQANLEQEEHTSEELEKMIKLVVGELAPIG